MNTNEALILLDNAIARTLLTRPERQAAEQALQHVAAGLQQLAQLREERAQLREEKKPAPKKKGTPA